MSDSTSREDKNIYPRLSVQELAKKEKQWSLFIQAFTAMQNLPKEDIRSFYQIAGIHGLPYVPYDNVKGDWTPNSGRWGGYCHHGVETFPTWHRAYMLLIENSLKELADAIVARNNLDDTWKTASKQLRLPYWDWASRETELAGVPTILTDSKIEIVTPNGKSSVPNPLRAFTLPEDVGSVVTTADFSNPTQKPKYEPPSRYPYTPKGYATVRHPTSEYISDVNDLNLGLKLFCTTVLRPGIFQIFTVDDYQHFSNHFSLMKDDTVQDASEYGHFASLEVVHDTFHAALGGNGGHMSHPDVASFDPIFFLHHCNVDRYFALWQAIYPDEYVKPFIITNSRSETFTLGDGAKVDADTPLTPFRKSKGSEKFWTSNELRDTRALGYYYPELEIPNPNPKEFREKILNYYRPDNWTQIRWFVNFPNIKKRQGGGPFNIKVFVDMPEADENTPITNIHYAGSISVFARDGDTQCANCMVNTHMKGSIDITKTMYNLEILVPRPDVTSSSTFPLDDGSESTQNPLGDKTITVVVATLDNKKLPTDIAGDYNITWAMELDTPEKVEKFQKSANKSGKLRASNKIHPAMIGGRAKSSHDKSKAEY